MTSDIDLHMQLFTHGDRVVQNFKVWEQMCTLPQPEILVKDDSNVSYNNTQMENLRFSDMIYTFSHRFTVLRTLCGHRNRKTYLCKDNLNNQHVCIKLNRLAYENIPAEVTVRYKLVDSSANISLTGWSPLIKNRVYGVIEQCVVHTDIIDSIDGDPFLIANFIRQIASFMLKLYQAGYIHDNITYDHILYNGLTNKAYVTGMQSVQLRNEMGYTSSKCVAENLSFVSPEKRLVINYTKHKNSTMPSPYTDRADVYSVGIILYMLLTNTKTAPSDETFNRWTRKVTKKYDPVSTHPPLDLVLRMTAYESWKRISWWEILNHPFLQGKHDMRYAEQVQNYVKDALQISNDKKISDVPINGDTVTMSPKQGKSLFPNQRNPLFVHTTLESARRDQKKPATRTVVPHSELFDKERPKLTRSRSL